MTVADYRTASEEHRHFQERYRVGKCFACGDGLDSYDRSRPCVHWYLRPVGFTKKDMPIVAEAVSLFQAQLFMRWLANEDAMGVNINDMADEGTGKLVELTIRYHDCEWAISCSEGDLRGHENGSAEANIPHYHVQFRYRKQSFVKFNDFHLPLHPSDIEVIERIKANPKASVGFAGGASIGDLFARVSPQDLIRQGISTGDEDNAPLSLSTIIMADPGQTISGDDLADIIARAKAQGRTITSMLPELKGVSVQTTISPGPGVVEQSVRSGRGKKGWEPDR